jgi:crotonobetainyl-CoA:carnitine CoA-transferase CaiB-like acyl-CoA transferase
VIADPFDVLNEPHLQAREFWQEERSGMRVPGRFVRFTEGAERSRSFSGGGQRSGPLSGVRVLDFSWALVGSITTKTMGDLGGEVIKVETRSRPCLSRIDVQVSASQPGDFDDKPWFAHLNTSKKSLTLDLKRPESREVLDPLIAWADVVVENFSPGTMAKLGLDFASLAAKNPGLIMVSGSVYGQTGPLAQEWGVDGTGAALSGRTYLTGWPDRGPVVPGAVPYGDVIVPFVMAAAAAAGLQHRRETGRGCWIDASMYEICVQQTRDAIIRAQQGEVPARAGNSDSAYFLQGVFPALGEDRWVAISIEDQTEWERVRAALDLGPGPCGEVLARWTGMREDSASAELLQGLGVAAGAVQDIEDLVETDPQLAARSALVLLDHPHLGSFGHVRTPLTFSVSATQPYRAPGLGEHSTEIARSTAGLFDARIHELQKAGVFR